LVLGVAFLYLVSNGALRAYKTVGALVAYETLGAVETLVALEDG